MTTTKPNKVAKPSLRRPKQPKRPSFLRDLAAEMSRLTGGRIWDPGYLSNLVTGLKVNKGLNEAGTLDKAIANLEAKAAKAKDAR